MQEISEHTLAISGKGTCLSWFVVLNIYWKCQAAWCVGKVSGGFSVYYDHCKATLSHSEQEQLDSAWGAVDFTFSKGNGKKKFAANQCWCKEIKASLHAFITLKQPSRCHMVSPLEMLGSACLNCCEVTESFWEKGMIPINLRAEKSGTHSHAVRLPEAQTNFPDFIRHSIFCTAGVEGCRWTHGGDAVRYTLPLHC